MRKIAGMALLLGTLLIISSCGGGDTQLIGENSNDIVVSPQSSAEQSTLFTAPTDANSFQSALYTRQVSEIDFDVWQCTRPGSSVPEVAYALPVIGTFGIGKNGREYSLLTGGESYLIWQALDRTTLQTINLDTGAVIETTNYHFTGESHFSFESDGARFNCDSVNNGVAYGGESTTLEMDTDGASQPVEPGTPFLSLIHI